MAGRGSSIMEHTAGCRDSSSVSQRFDCLTHVSRCFQTGTCPTRSAAEVARVIFSGVCGPVPGEDRESGPAESCDLTCISVSLVERITSDLTSRVLPPALTSYCGEILTVFQDLDLMSQLVQLFHAEDQIISHLAAKTASTCVCYQLLKSGTVSPVWQQKCVQTFYNSALGPELDACLWSLTEVLKRLLKGAHQDILGKLLSAFDSSLSALCSKFLPEERKEATQCSVERWGTTFCLLLDLLEVLTASSLICGAGVCLKSQRITHIHSSALLTTISCCSEYFVKKRALLLLKRAVLQKAGEDWASGDVLSTGIKHKHFSSDMSLLAHSVLTAVATNWLQSVQVESASFFGGARCVRVEEGQKPDCVMLRAVSLLLLKSIELHIQTAGGAGADSAAEVSGYLQNLWGFLQQCGVQLTEVTHRCCWISLLFGEQDDDMMEAAKALLSIFLHHRRCSGLEDSAVLEAACASGCNPHCHFLLLLQSISFDHSILLDFLISTETCFLEYFVRYLKYQRADWPGFTAACGRISWPQLSLTASCGGDVLKVTCKGQPDGVELSSCDQPTGVTSPVGTMSSAAGIHLVEYDSSDESEPEDMEVCQDEPGAAVCENISAMDVKQEISGQPVPIKLEQYESLNSPGSLSEPNSTPERRPGGPPLSVLQTEEASRPGSQVTCKTLARAVLCMSALREVVTRLQMKKLFPYNPSSLLKLLAQVENCS
ncbi:protein Lines homolog 1 isoform X2 [Epinephelus fuscoguttatus]|uniref:protein Lines homolog 1 isoform X2 n=1 Tax=Epinephelus fuscoguttatus TaxID=293821 RepID=UPI0020D0993E|nr:protein Lines homolog 1 isoform X2 [Epinephelus fuscoguttatus]